MHYTRIVVDFGWRQQAEEWPPASLAQIHRALLLTSMSCENYRSSNTDFVVTNDVIDFKFLYEGSSAEMLWTLSRSVTEADGSTTNGGVGLLKANGEKEIGPCHLTCSVHWI